MEAVASQPPVAPGGSVDVTPVAGGASMTTLPSAMKELARFFLNLSGSLSLGASGDSAGVTASGAVLGELAGPSSSAAGAATVCGTAATPAGAGVLPDASDALPSMSGEHRRRVRSRSRDRRSRSSDDRTDRRAKKRSRRRSPSLERSSRRREKRYRSSSDSSEDERAAASSPRARRAHGGARAGGSTWDYGRPRSYARVDPDQSGTRRRSPGPSGVADDDRSTTFESVDFARDDSFQAVLALIRGFMIWRNRQLYQGLDARLLLRRPMVWRWILIRRSRCRFPPYYRLSWSTSTRTRPSSWRTRLCTGFFPCPVAGSGGITAPPPPLFLGPTQSHLA